jgi:hypothetical protein
VAPADAPSEQVGFKQIVLWATFTVLLTAGVYLFFRNPTVVRPLLEAVTDK